jgi:NADPH-dependent curcumin reductase CurA
LKEELGADEVLNYKGWKTVDDARQALEQACPKGVDVYFGILASSPSSPSNLSHAQD